MTDGYPGREAVPGSADGPAPARSRLLLGGGLAVMLLAVIGASGGWLLAGENSAPPAPPVAAGTARPASTGDTPPVTDSPRSTPPVTGTTGRTSAAGLTVPKLIGTDFVAARAELRERKLGWRLVFGEGSGRTGTVLAQDPTAASPARWNDPVALSCGTEASPTLPSPTP